MFNFVAKLTAHSLFLVLHCVGAAFFGIGLFFTIPMHLLYMKKS